MKKINVGLVGYKFMGKAHSHAYKDMSMFFDTEYVPEMKVLCGRDETGVREAAEKFGWKEYETSWEKMIARDDIDLVDIAAPSNYHKEIAIAAAKAKKDIFCEKPLALTLVDAREMLRVAEENGVRHMIGFNYRFVPAICLARKLIREGTLGTLYHFRGCYLQDWIVDPNFPLVWRLNKKVAGSGSHGDLGAHIIDLARDLMGEFDEVIGISKTFIKERPVVGKMTGLSGIAEKDAAKVKVDVDDATLFLARFKNGAMGNFEATRFATGHKNDLHFEINGSKGSIRFEFERMNELQYYNENDRDDIQGFRVIQASAPVHQYMSAWWPTGHVIGYDSTFVHEMYEYMEAIHKGTNPKPDFHDGVKCSQILTAVDKSIEDRRWYKVDEV